MKEEKSIFTEMKESDLSDIDRKIHALLIAEGYRADGAKRFEGLSVNNYTDINQTEFRRGDRERVILITHKPQKKTA